MQNKFWSRQRPLLLMGCKMIQNMSKEYIHNLNLTEIKGISINKMYLVFLTWHVTILMLLSPSDSLLMVELLWNVFNMRENFDQNSSKTEPLQNKELFFSNVKLIFCGFGFNLTYLDASATCILLDFEACEVFTNFQ